MSQGLQWLKAHLFVAVLVLAYFAAGILRPELAVQGLSNTGYYIKEMLMIMPVIFVLTALMDSWVPKETIIKYLGAQAGVKGMALSFVLGSVSAGPVYAAFPFCIMLHGKGASIRNVTIILSAWAVVKVPMLLNEAKFLGLRFMVLRWLLTLVAILILSWLTDHWVTGKDFPKAETVTALGLIVDRQACMGCTLCKQSFPQHFVMEGKKARSSPGRVSQEQLQEILELCPVQAIAYEGE